MSTIKQLYDKEKAELEALEAQVEKLSTRCDRQRVFVEELELRLGGPDQPGRYGGMTKLEAARLCLKDRGKPMGAAEIRDALLSGGFQHKSKNDANFYATLYNVLKEAVEKEGSGVVKVGSKYGLG